MGIKNLLPATSIARKAASDPALATHPVCEASDYMCGRVIGDCNAVHDESWMMPSPLGWESCGAQPVCGIAFATSEADPFFHSHLGLPRDTKLPAQGSDYRHV